MKTLIIACVLFPLATAAAWNVPAPDNIEHPGAKEAPASDPRSYPDADGFRQRADLIIAGLKDEDLGRWRRGYFAGGDPGKYLPGAAMAKLLADPQAADARRYMNDDRSYKEHYHFAALNWARFLPLFGDALTAETKQKLADTVAKYAYFGQGGTENHKVMWLTSANVLPAYISGDRFSSMTTSAALARAKEELRRYVKGLYAAGQGEWDSGTYLMFDLHGMLNVYDFSKDPQCRLLAKAALDWYAAAYALKYTDGLYCGPNQRGYYDQAISSIADQTGWLWWGTTASYQPTNAPGFRYAMHAVTSGWRPNAVLCNIARRQLPRLPVEQRNTKPNYWFGQNLPPAAGLYAETVYIAPQFTIGTLWNGHGSQITRFQIAIATPQGAVGITGGNPRQSDHTGKKTGLGFRDGNGRYTQFAAHENVVVSLSQAPLDDSDAAFSFVTVPDGVTPQPASGGWWTMKVHTTTVHIYPLGAKAEFCTSEPGREGRTLRYLKIAGHRTGFVAVVGDASAVRVDTNRFATAMEVRCALGGGRSLEVRFAPAPDGDAHGNRLATVRIDGQSVNPKDWPIYSGPYVAQQPAILTVNDGRSGFVVDFNGDWPVYRASNP